MVRHDTISRSLQCRGNTSKALLPLKQNLRLPILVISTFFRIFDFIIRIRWCFKILFLNFQDFNESLRSFCFYLFPRSSQSFLSFLTFWWSSILVFFDIFNYKFNRQHCPNHCRRGQLMAEEWFNCFLQSAVGRRNHILLYWITLDHIWFSYRSRSKDDKLISIKRKTSFFIYFVSLFIKLLLLLSSHMLYFILSLVNQWSQWIIFGCIEGEFITVGAEIVPVREQTQKNSLLQNTKQLKYYSVKERCIKFPPHSLAPQLSNKSHDIKLYEKVFKYMFYLDFFHTWASLKTYGEVCSSLARTICSASSGPTVIWMVGGMVDLRKQAMITDAFCRIRVLSELEWQISYRKHLGHKYRESIVVEIYNRASIRASCRCFQNRGTDNLIIITLYLVLLYIIKLLYNKQVWHNKNFGT